MASSTPVASSTLVTSSTPETRHSSIAPTTQGYVNARQDRLPPIASARSSTR
ncbi:hypothetical protein FLM52_10560 [bacterium Scap17]|nr:hypothetical protein [bacterium Scap17]